MSCFAKSLSILTIRLQSFPSKNWRNPARGEKHKSSKNTEILVTDITRCVECGSINDYVRDCAQDNDNAEKSKTGHAYSRNSLSRVQEALEAHESEEELKPSRW